MIEYVIQAIANKLKELFPKIKIYDEDVEQHYEEPCFFIIWENDDEQKLVGNRYDIRPKFRIIYFQDLQEKNSNNKIYKIREKLASSFNNITYENLHFRITEKHFEKQDKDLHLTFDVNHQVKIVKDEEKFKEIDTNISKKEGIK